MLLTQQPDIELDTLVSIVSWVWNRVTAFIGVCNDHHSFWIPVGFAIAGMTVHIFKSALNVPSNKNY